MPDTDVRPGEALSRLRELIADGFAFEPSAPTRYDGEPEVVTALALASIAESLHSLVSGEL